MDEEYPITELVSRWGHGDRVAESLLFRRLYSRLHQVAAFRMRGERRDHTLTPTALVSEAYLRLSAGRAISCHDRKHFLALASKVMRDVLVDHSRRHKALKRDARYARPETPPHCRRPNPSLDSFLDVALAIERLSRRNGRRADIAAYRFVAGMTLDEIAHALKVSRSTVKRELRIARAHIVGLIELRS